MNARTSF